MAERKALTPQEVADHLQIAKNTVYELIKRGELIAYKVGNKFRVDASELERYKQQGSSAEVYMGFDLNPKEALGTAFAICGQDVILDSLSSHLRHETEQQIFRSYDGSYNGLYALYNNEVMMATAHLWDGDTNTYNTPYVRRLLPGIPAVIIRLVKRQQGFYVAKGNPLSLKSFKDILKPNIRMVNREKGSGTRVLLDEHLRKLNVFGSTILGYDQEVGSHIAIASAVARGEADVGLGNEKAALQVAEVTFLPLQEECYDLVIKTEDIHHPIIAKALDIIQSDSFKDEVAGLGGYDVSSMGEIVARI